MAPGLPSGVLEDSLVALPRRHPASLRGSPQVFGPPLNWVRRRLVQLRMPAMPLIWTPVSLKVLRVL